MASGDAGEGGAKAEAGGEALPVLPYAGARPMGPVGPYGGVGPGGAVGQVVPPPLDAEQLRQLADSRVAAKKIRRAVSVALFDGWTIGIFAALTLACGFASVSGVVMGLGLGAIAWVELSMAGRVKRLDPKAARYLAFNQVVLAALLIGYAMWNLFGPQAGGQLDEVVRSNLPEMADEIESLARAINLAVYGGLIAVAILAQGGTALFYFRRERMIRAYLKSTPAWIIHLQQTGVLS